MQGENSTMNQNESRPEELLYRMGHSTRAMQAFFAMDDTEQAAILARIAADSDPSQLDREMERLEALGQDYYRPDR